MFGLLFLAASALSGLTALQTFKAGRLDRKGLDLTRARHPAIFWTGVGTYGLFCAMAAAAGLAMLLGFGLTR